MALFLENLRCYVTETTCEGMKLLIRGVEMFGSRLGVKRQTKWLSTTDAHAKVCNDNITVSRLRPIENIFRPGKDSINLGSYAWAREDDVLEISVNDIVIVQVLHSSQY